ncbi:uncharacterized protein LOC110730427 [Chenopodium quinoa]|uniref:uncharacterized protein LOC110730427 n=1 Tax=Chenopodium quinoa TaxID=63459 RepID=UPI000B794DEF|nr:uncharacterized protein LOC110730427 [Chenopodium quinoa]
MELPSTSKDDFIYWKFHPSERYTVKTRYSYLMKEEKSAQDVIPSEKDQEFVKLIWRMNIQPKWKIFLWKLYHDGIAVKENLARRGIQIDNICGYCGVAPKDSQHLFRFCILAKKTWGKSPLAICSDSAGFNLLRNWIQSFILLFNSEDGKHSNRIVLFIATLWGLWRTRNERSFNGTTGGARKERDDPALPPGFIYVQLGQEKEGFENFLVEVDGSWDKKTKRAGIGWSVVGNGEEMNSNDGGRHGAANSVLQCEAWACLEAMK